MGVDTNGAAHLAFTLGIMMLQLIFRYKTGIPGRSGTREPRFLTWLFQNNGQLQQEHGLDIEGIWNQVGLPGLDPYRNANPQRAWCFDNNRRPDPRFGHRIINGLLDHIHFYLVNYENRSPSEIDQIIGNEKEGGSRRGLLQKLLFFRGTMGDLASLFDIEEGEV
jgi:hypothetical protein